MSAFADIEQLIRPTALTSFRENMPPVICNIWQGGDSFTKLTLDKVYPFDTIENVKRMICTIYKDDPAFIPRFVFMGIKVEERTYLSSEYYLYPIGTFEAKNTIILKDPRDSIESPDPKFVSPDGSFPAINVSHHERSTLEDIYLNVRGEIPEFYVFTLRDLINAYKGPKPISEAAWNSRFYPYFFDRDIEAPYKPSENDLAFAKTIHRFIEEREKQTELLNSYLEDLVPVPEVQVTGVRMLRLEIQKPPAGFSGAEALFYNLKVNDRRPFMRLLPSSGTPVSKVHVNGIIPIPTLDNPELIRDWAKETSPTRGNDFFFIKYLHTPRITHNQCSVYGTIRVGYNGVMDVMVQPPKDRRKLEPTTDFKNFKPILSQAIEGLPHSVDSFKLGEAAILFSLKTSIRDQKFNRKRLESRLPLFQTFFQPITALPGQNPILSIRYKAVSQYASEDRIFSFITQYVTKQMLDGQTIQDVIVRELSSNFQMSEIDAKKVLANWLDKKSKYTVIVPDENEFMEKFNPGIDIHVYAQHPIYTVHANRIDSFDTFQRIYTLIGLLFMDDDDLFKVSVTDLAGSEEKLEEEQLEREGEETGVEDVADLAGVATAAESMGLGDEFTGMFDDELALEALDEEAAKKAAAVTNAVAGTLGLTPTAPTSVAAAAAAAPAASVPVKDRVVKPKEEEEEGPIIPNNWFINKLIDIDPVLFKYTPTVAGKGYSRICQVQDDKQPSVLTPEQYERMREVYLPDEEKGEVFFKEYPLEGKEDPKVPRGAEVYTVLKFGSDPARPNYFFCPPLYCLRDQIMVREKDFAATVDRKGNPKEKDSCPFCGGKIITSRTVAMPNRTVIRKKAKEASGNQPTHIGFHQWDTKKFLIKDTAHPSGLPLPCCGIKDQVLRLKYDVFEKFREQAAAASATAELPSKDEEITTTKVGEIDFAVLFAALHTEYIIGAEKFPLLMGKFAVVPPTFENYFAQDSTKFINRTAIRQELKPKGSGFLRVGVENSNTESVLAVIAPLLNRSYISEVKELILEKCIPRIFLYANFGNLVHEFYAPSDTPPTDNELRKWASKFLQVDVTSDNNLSIMRVYLAYKRFVEFIQDSKKPKELRHIAPLLAEPGLFAPRGIQLIVLDWDATRPNDPVVARCPAYGLSFERHKRADFAFVSRNVRSTDSKCSTSSLIVNYELFVHTFNQPGGGSAPDTHITTTQWQYAERANWPSIVQTRIDEFLEQCKSRYTSLYTPQSGVNPLTLLPLSRAIGIMAAEGVIRDSYNHAVALTYKTREKGASPLVAFPVVDDGHFYGLQLRIHMDWTDFTKASLEETLAFYRDTLAGVFKFDLNTGYTPIRAVRSESGEWAIQLRSGIYVPVGPPTGALESLGIEVEDVDHFEWDINQAIANSEKCGSDPLVAESNEEKLEELYQHFRLSVANWLTSRSGGAEFRRLAEGVIFNSILPEYEKRKRLDILLSGSLQNWFAADEGQWELPTSFVRKDCRVIGSPDSCSGACKWVPGTGGSGKCKLHIPTRSYIGSRLVSTSMLFTKRVIDELVRFPNRRMQLLQRKVSEISSLIEPIRQGDQYIIPEKMPDPFSLLRLDWAIKEPEKPRFYEEMTEAEEEAREEGGQMPEDLADFLGPRSGLYFWQPEAQNEEDPLAPFAPAMDLDLADIGVAPGALDFTKSNLTSYVKQMVRPIGKIDLRGAKPEILMIRPFRGVYDRMLLFVFSNEGVGLLAEFEGLPDVGISALPPVLREFWDDPEKVTLVQVKKKDVARQEAIRQLRKAEETQVEMPAPKEVNEGVSLAAEAPVTFRKVRRSVKPSQEVPMTAAPARLSTVPEENMITAASMPAISTAAAVAAEEEAAAAALAEEQAAVAEEEVAAAEEQVAVAEQAAVAEEQAAVAEEQVAVAEEQAAVAEQAAIAEEQAAVIEQPTEVQGKTLLQPETIEEIEFEEEAAPAVEDAFEAAISKPVVVEQSVPANIKPYDRENIWMFVYTVYNLLNKVSNMLYAGGAAGGNFNYTEIANDYVKIQSWLRTIPKIQNAEVNRNIMLIQGKLSTLIGKKTKETMELAFNKLFTDNNIRVLLESIYKYAKKASDIKNTFEIELLQGVNTTKMPRYSNTIESAAALAPIVSMQKTAQPISLAAAPAPAISMQKTAQPISLAAAPAPAISMQQTAKPISLAAAPAPAVSMQQTIKPLASAPAPAASMQQIAKPLTAAPAPVVSLQQTAKPITAAPAPAVSMQQTAKLASIKPVSVKPLSTSALKAQLAAVMQNENSNAEEAAPAPAVAPAKSVSVARVSLAKKPTNLKASLAALAAEASNEANE